MAVSLSFQSAPIYLREPVIGSEPVYRGRYLKRIHARPRNFDFFYKPKDIVNHDIDPSEQQHQQLTVPYRLPKISPRCVSPVDAVLEENRPHREDTVWGRFGYEPAVRIPTLLPSVNKMMVNTPSNMAVPHFQNAGIMPLKFRQRQKMEDKMLKNLLAKAEKCQTAREAMRGEPTPSPVYSRAASPSKSAKSIHWTLGDHIGNNSPIFDKKGRSRVQGPFSREFTVTCFAPHNWLRLKLGRSKSMIR